MKKVYAYIRVSTKKQEQTLSLPQQKKIIQKYSDDNQLTIVKWYEEKKTAAKTGRPLFTEMMQNLKLKKADGVVIHKIDRSARNLHDWADIGDLIDSGIEVRFAHESIDLNERGGRLSADIQAVMAADYIRNLRQEAIKGIYGRLEQGLFPFRAPVGYLNNGKAKIKTPDPNKSHLIQELFRLYTEEGIGVIQLVDIMKKKGLRNVQGGSVTKNGIVTILKNPFYVGLMKVKGKEFVGKHEPIITIETFKRAQKTLKEKTNIRTSKHNMLFRRRINCKNCNYKLIGEKQKGNIYYRCHTKGCVSKTIRESTIHIYIKNFLATLVMSQEEFRYVIDQLQHKETSWHLEQGRMANLINLNIKKVKTQIEKLNESYFEKGLDRDYYENKKRKLHLKRKEYDAQKKDILTEKPKFFTTLLNFLELLNNVTILYDRANLQQKRRLVELLTSNLEVDRNKLIILPKSPFLEVSNRDILELCDPSRTYRRTKLFNKIVYMNIKTSPIIPKSLDKNQLNNFVDYLVEIAPLLPEIRDIDINDIQTNNTNT